MVVNVLLSFRWLTMPGSVCSLICLSRARHVTGREARYPHHLWQMGSSLGDFHGCRGWVIIFHSNYRPISLTLCLSLFIIFIHVYVCLSTHLCTLLFLCFLFNFIPVCPSIYLLVYSIQSISFTLELLFLIIHLWIYLFIPPSNYSYTLFNHNSIFHSPNLLVDMYTSLLYISVYLFTSYFFFFFGLIYMFFLIHNSGNNIHFLTFILIFVFCL